MTSVNYIKPFHYNVLASWMAAHALPITPPEYLTNGVVIMEEEAGPVCAGFLYQLGSTPMFWIEGIISNPNSEKEIKDKALKKLITALTEKAKEQGCNLLMGSTPRDGLKQVFINSGFGEAPEKYNHLARGIM